jgi:hypothetical protein
VWFEKLGKMLDTRRIKMRTEYELEMKEEMGYCSGIENYSWHIAGRPLAQACSAVSRQLISGRELRQLRSRLKRLLDSVMIAKGRRIQD